MKLLFVSLFLPQQRAHHAGGRYVYELLAHLSKKHDIYLATRLEEEELPLLEALRPLCREIYPYVYRTVSRRGLVDKLKLVVNYLGFSRFADQLIQQGNYDLVQVEWVETALLIRKWTVPMVLDAHDVITKPVERVWNRSRGFRRVVARLKYLLVKQVERNIMKRFTRIFTLSEFDRKYLQRMAPELEQKVVTVPIPAGLDITDRCYEVKDNTILFLASYKYRQVNVDGALWFYQKVFPLIRSRIPDAQFIIAGYGPPAELTALAVHDPHVVVLGFVDDIDRCYKEAAVFVAPILTGGGIIVKILDALAAGRPVVTTPYGNEGIGAQPGSDLLIADDPRAFADGVITLLTEPEIARQIASSGTVFVKEHYSFAAINGIIDATYRDMCLFSPLQ